MFKVVFYLTRTTLARCIETEGLHPTFDSIQIVVFDCLCHLHFSVSQMSHEIFYWKICEVKVNISIGDFSFLADEKKTT